MLLLEAVASAALFAQLAAVMLPSRRNTSHCTHAGSLLSRSHRVSGAEAGVGRIAGVRGWVVGCVCNATSGYSLALQVTDIDV